MSYQNGIINHLIQNKIEIYFPDGDVEPIAEGNIVSESLTLKQSICDGEALTFGGCVASELNIKLINTAERQFSNELADKWISVKMTQYFADPDELVYPSGTLFPSGGVYPGTVTGEQSFWIFSGYIDSATVDKTDKNVINVTAYDALAKAHEEDFTNWLYDFWWRTGDKSVGTILTRSLHLDDGVVIPVNDINNVMAEKVDFVDRDRHTLDHNPHPVWSYSSVNKTWMSNQDTISKGMAAKFICELFGVFGFIQPNDGKGEFVMRTLAGVPEVYGFYEQLSAEDYQSTGYTDFKFSVEGSSTGKSSKASDVEAVGGLSDLNDDAVPKTYDFTKNIFIWEKYGADGNYRTTTDADVLVNQSSIGTRLAINAESDEHVGQCAYSAYQPLTATLDGRLWVTVGSPIEILVSKTDVNGDYVLDENGNIQKETVKTYLLSRTLSGIQALTDKIEVKGVR